MADPNSGSGSAPALSVDLGDAIRALIDRGVVSIVGEHITYRLAGRPRRYRWSNPEERVRANTLAFLIVRRGYPANRIKTEVPVPRRTPHDVADIVVFSDDACRSPYLVVETKADGQTGRGHDQAVEQVFGNANSLRAAFALYDSGSQSRVFDVANHPPTERVENRLGDREAVPHQYDELPEYALIAHSASDIKAVPAAELSNAIRRAHSLIWAGGKRDPLRAFDEWSKLLFVKVLDERATPTDNPRRFQAGRNETAATVATRVHALFAQAIQRDPSVFPPSARIELHDDKVYGVVRLLQGIAFTHTDIDAIGVAFETFFGSVFRGELGQYFTMRPLARFIVAMLDIPPGHAVLDPTAGSGGFLLEALIQGWRRIEQDYRGSSHSEVAFLKADFAHRQLFGIEIHETLARICRINLLLHHDGHANIEGDRSCLDTSFGLAGLADWRGRFACVVGNPPFGEQVKRGDRDTLGDASLEDFEIARGRREAPSEHVIVERSCDFLRAGGCFGLILPDGMFNNQGELSNCPQARRLLSRVGRILAIVSLPDHAFRPAGAQNKTSILFFQKFTEDEAEGFGAKYRQALDEGRTEDEAILAGHAGDGRWVFLAEADSVGYSPSGTATAANDLYACEPESTHLRPHAEGTILAGYRAFLADPAGYAPTTRPRTMAIPLTKLLGAHASGRIDPKYHLFKEAESRHVPAGWITRRIGETMRRRLDEAHPERRPDERVTVLTISQTGELSRREPGKGRNPPEWLGMYFEDSPSRWYAARAGDVVFSSIDLWKGCIAVVPPELDGALVTREFPIYEVTDERLSPDFLSAMLRSRYYQRAFRAITTGHSNRRRTQTGDFEDLEIAFPPEPREQQRLLEAMQRARREAQSGRKALVAAARGFDTIIEGSSEGEPADRSSV